MQDKPRENAENHFTTLLNFIADPVVITDEKGCFVVVNEAFEETTGVKKENIIGKPFTAFNNITPETKTVLRENLKKRSMGVPIQPYEISFTDKTGETRQTEVKAKKMNYDGKPAFLVVFRDITRRKRNEHRLKEYSEKLETLVDKKVREIKESREKLKSIFDSSPYAITEVDLKGGIIECNQTTVQQQSCSSRDELIGKTCFDLVAPKDRQKAISCFQKALKTGNIKRVELTLTNKDNKTFIVSLSARLMKDASGKPKSFVTITKNITERKQIEMELREAEKRYHALFDQAPLGILLIDPETARAVEFNEEAHRQLGYSREEFAELSIFNYEVIETPEETKAHMKRVLQQGKDEFETKHRAKNGEIRDVVNHVQVIELNGKKLLHIITRDITEQKKMEADVKQKLDMLEAMTENLGVGLGIISKDYRVLWVNKFIKNNVGDVEGKQCYSSLNTLDHICPDCGVRKVFEEGVERDFHEYSQIGVHGDMYHVELIATPLKDKDGNITAALEFVVDIAEKKRMQRQLTEYSQKLEKLVEKKTAQLKQTQAKLVKSERLATIGELAAMVGHDLRNPLTGITGAVYYLKAKQKQKNDPKIKQMIDVIDECINYSNKIIDDLLDYSRELKLEPTETNPRKLLSQSLSMIKIPKNVKITDTTQDEPKITVDEAKMNRIFVNIIKNSIEAMPNGGTLTITSKAAKRRMKITCTDTGAGMTRETLRKIGSPLFTTKSKGMGFGLAICKRIVEAHGGRMHVKSAVGKGTTITVTVPVRPKLENKNEETWIVKEPELQTTK
jgi:PAS domain S-box-containing protein